MYVNTTDSFAQNARPISFPMISNSSTEMGHIRTMKPEQKLFFEGDKSDCVYQVIEGVLMSSKVQANGQRQILSFGYPGDIVGLSHDCHYHNDCEAVSATKVRVLHKNACSTRFDSDSEIGQQLLRYAAAEISAMQEHFLMLSRKSATEKMAAFLVTLSQRIGKQIDGEHCFNLPMRRVDIADFLGLTVETISRIFTKFRIEGIIRLPTHYDVCIRKMHALEEIAAADD